MDGSDSSQVLRRLRTPKVFPCPMCKSIFSSLRTNGHYCHACKFTYQSPNAKDKKPLTAKQNETCTAITSFSDCLSSLPSQLGRKEGAVSRGPPNVVPSPKCNSIVTEPSTAMEKEKTKEKEKAQEPCAAITGFPVKAGDLSSLLLELESEEGEGSLTDSEPPNAAPFCDECGIPVIPNPEIRPLMLPEQPVKEDHQSEVPPALKQALELVGFDCCSGAVVLVNRRSKKRPQGVGTIHLKMSDSLIYFHLSLEDAAKKLDVSKTTLKKACREFGIERWPGRKMRSLISKAAKNNVEATVAVNELVVEILKLIKKLH